MGDHAVVHHHHDTAGDTYDEGHAEQVTGTVDEVGGQLLLAHAGDEADYDGGGQEDAGDLRHPPAEHGHPVDHHGEGGDEDTQHYLASKSELQHLIALVAEEVGTVLFPLVGHQGLAGVVAHHLGVTHHIGHAQQPAGHQHGDPQPDAVGEGDAGRVGGDDGGEGVDGGAQGTDTGAEQDGCRCHHRVEAGGHHHGHQQGVEGQRLFRHAVDGAPCGEQRHQDRDHPLLAATQTIGDALDTGIDGTCLGHNAKEAADDQDEEGDVDGACLIGVVVVEAVDGCQQHVDYPLGIGIHQLVGTGHRHFLAEGFIHYHVVFAGRHYPAQGGHQGDQHKQYGVG
ncbi:hypothetical protein D3C80_869980 [compost metagenome]